MQCLLPAMPNEYPAHYRQARPGLVLVEEIGRAVRRGLAGGMMVQCRLEFVGFGSDRFWEG